MRRLFSVLVAIFFITGGADAQTMDSSLLTKNRDFTGATATLAQYRAIVQLDNNDPKVIEKAFRNTNNMLKDPRMAGKLQIELVTFAGGTEVVQKGSKYENDLKMLVEQGVIVGQCNNSLRERKLSRDQIYDFIAVVPSGAGEVVLRQAEGWSVLKP